MVRSSRNTDATLKTLTEIRTLLEDLLIIEGARAGIGKDEIREIVGVASARVTRIWKNIATTSGS